MWRDEWSSSMFLLFVNHGGGAIGPNLGHGIRPGADMMDAVVGRKAS